MTKPPPRKPGDRMTATQALAQNNFPPEKLIAYARHIANRKTHNHTHPDRQQDLISYLVETGLKYAIRYDPKHTSHTSSYTFSSYIYDIMETRVPDFYRRQSEGYADQRKGREAHQPVEEIDPPDLDEDSMERLTTPGRLIRWQAAADTTTWTLEEWISITLDAAANQLLKETP